MKTKISLKKMFLFFLRYTVATFLLQYFFPVCIISTTYCFVIHDVTKNPPKQKDDSVRRENRRVTKLLIIVTLTFVVCGLPFQVIGLIKVFCPVDTIGDEHHDASILSYFLLFLNSALNPILYNVFSSKFRGALSLFWRHTVKGGTRWRKRGLAVRKANDMDEDFGTRLIDFSSVRRKTALEDDIGKKIMNNSLEVP